MSAVATETKRRANQARLRLAFGAFSPKLKEQLQGYGLQKNEIERFQRRADEVTGLLIAGILTDTEAHRARKRLIKMIAKTIESI